MRCDSRATPHRQRHVSREPRAHPLTRAELLQPLLLPVAPRQPGALLHGGQAGDLHLPEPVRLLPLVRRAPRRAAPNRAASHAFASTSRNFVAPHLRVNALRDALCFSGGTSRCWLRKAAADAAGQLRIHAVLPLHHDRPQPGSVRPRPPHDFAASCDASAAGAEIGVVASDCSLCCSCKPSFTVRLVRPLRGPSLDCFCSAGDEQGDTAGVARCQGRSDARLGLTRGAHGVLRWGAGPQLLPADLLLLRLLPHHRLQHQGAQRR